MKWTSELADRSRGVAIWERPRTLFDRPGSTGGRQRSAGATRFGIVGGGGYRPPQRRYNHQSAAGPVATSSILETRSQERPNLRPHRRIVRGTIRAPWTADEQRAADSGMRLKISEASCVPLCRAITSCPGLVPRPCSRQMHALSQVGSRINAQCVAICSRRTGLGRCQLGDRVI